MNQWICSCIVTMWYEVPLDVWRWVLHVGSSWGQSSDQGMRADGMVWYGSKGRLHSSKHELIHHTERGAISLDRIFWLIYRCWLGREVWPYPIASTPTQRLVHHLTRLRFREKNVSSRWTHKNSSIWLRIAYWARVNPKVLVHSPVPNA